MNMFAKPFLGGTLVPIERTGRRLYGYRESTESKSTLTVSDMGQFAQKGGMVNLLTAGDRVRMIVNRGKSRRRGCAPVRSCCALPSL